MNERDLDAPTFVFILGVLGAVAALLLLLISGLLPLLAAVALGTVSFFLVVWSVVVWGTLHALDEHARRTSEN